MVVNSPPPELGEDLREDTSPALVHLKEASTTLTWVKCKPVREMLGPVPKRSRMDQPIPDLRELDRLAGLMTSVWGEVTDVREAIHAAEGCLRTMEGHLHDIDDWVRTCVGKPKGKVDSLKCSIETKSHYVSHAFEWVRN